MLADKRRAVGTVGIITILRLLSQPFQPAGTEDCGQLFQPENKD